MTRVRGITLFILGLLVLTGIAGAEVERIEITSRSVFANGKAFGEVGAYANHRSPAPFSRYRSGRSGSGSDDPAVGYSDASFPAVICGRPNSALKALSIGSSERTIL